MNLKESLTRKLGPLPAWAWLLLFGVGVWYYRNKMNAVTGATSGTGTGSVGPTPTTPQPVTTLDPGQSVYDPNTGGLTTAPGGGLSSGENSGSGTTIGSGGQDPTVGALTPTTPGQDTTAPPPDTPNTPAPGTVGLPGRLQTWHYRKNKGKPQHGQKVKITKFAKPGTKGRARSTTTVHVAKPRTKAVESPHKATVPATPRARWSPGRAVAAAKVGSKTHTVNKRTPTQSKMEQPPRARNRPKVAAVTQVVVQRPVAVSTPNRQVLANPPRPSAPAVRQVRTQEPAKAKPPARRHK